MTDKIYGIDTETTGLSPYHGDRPFCLTISTEKGGFFVDISDWKTQESLFLDESITWCAHNMKFDLAMLKSVGIELKGKLHCTMVTARLLNNIRESLSLDSVAKDYGLQKDDKVKAYILENKLYTKDGSEKHLHFDQVPREILIPYAIQDAVIVREIAIRQLAEMEERLLPVYQTEMTLLRIVQKMEERGVLVDTEACEVYRQKELERMLAAESTIFNITGKDFKKSAKFLAPYIEEKDREYTEKGNIKTDHAALSKIDSDIARAVSEWSDAKATHNYFEQYLKLVTVNKTLHPEFKQAGTVTGRFSAARPNLQNIRKAEEGEAASPVRSVLIPRPGYYFQMFDMDQAEYRLMLDYANAKRLIAKVLGGLDVHAATAEVAVIPRGQAKTVNFALVYGSGMDALAKSLKTTKEKTLEIFDKIYSAAPEMWQFISGVKKRAKKRGFIFNWTGRIYRFPDASTTYKAPNALIQGGVGDIVKRAMVDADNFMRLMNMKTRLILNIHDELVFEVPFDEAKFMPALKGVLEGAYKHKYLPLTWGADYSMTSLGGKKEGYPTPQELEEARQFLKD